MVRPLHMSPLPPDSYTRPVLLLGLHFPGEETEEEWLGASTQPLLWPRPCLFPWIEACAVQASEGSARARAFLWRCLRWTDAFRAVSPAAISHLTSVCIRGSRQPWLSVEGTQGWSDHGLSPYLALGLAVWHLDLCLDSSGAALGT